ncbi:MAG: protein phosphatase, partial [Propionibacteriaceae bacterium]|nr:protein phosphatase [Propionibacteriaceae bacterium]
MRKENQDSGYASATLLMVADGMGGAAAGDLASRIAVDEFYQIDQPSSGEAIMPSAGDAMIEQLEQAAQRANDRLADLIETDPDLDGMGTTICGGLF